MAFAGNNEKATPEPRISERLHYIETLVKRHQLEAKTSSSTMAYTHVQDRQQGLEEHCMAVAGFPACLMPEFVPFVDRATGLIIWKTYSTATARDPMLSQEDAERFSADLDQLIAETRPKKQTRFSMLTLQQKPNISHPQPDTGPWNTSASLLRHEASLGATYMSDPRLYTPQVTENDHYPQCSSMTWKADSLQISEFSNTASKVPLQGRPPGKGSKLIPASQKQSGKQYQSTTSKQTAKQLTPNQIYGRIVKDYVDHPAKMAQLEQFLQSLPTGESSLSHTICANASPYEQLFIYQRLTRVEHHGRQSYEQVHRKYLSMRLQLQVEVNPSFFKTLVDAGVPLSKKNAASLKLWMEEKEARKETRLGNKAPTKAADDRGELTHALLQHQSSREDAFATNMARIDKLHKSDQSTLVTPGKSSPTTSPDAQSEVAPSDLKPFLIASATEFQPRLILCSQSPHDSVAVDTKPSR